MLAGPLARLERQPVVDGVTAVIRVIDKSGIVFRPIEEVLAELLSATCAVDQNVAAIPRLSGTHRAGHIQVLCSNQLVRGNKQIAAADCQALSDFSIDLKAGLFGIGGPAIGVHSVRSHGVEEPARGRGVGRKEKVRRDLPGGEQNLGIGCRVRQIATWRGPKNSRILVERVSRSIRALTRARQFGHIAGSTRRNRTIRTIEYVAVFRRRPLWKGHEQEAQVVTVVEYPAADSNDRSSVRGIGEPDPRSKVI